MRIKEGDMVQLRDGSGPRMFVMVSSIWSRELFCKWWDSREQDFKFEVINKKAVKVCDRSS